MRLPGARRPVAAGGYAGTVPAQATTTAIGLETPIGTLGVEATEEGLRRVRLPGENRVVQAAEGGARSAGIARAAAAQLVEYLDGERKEFEIDLDWVGVASEHRHLLEVLCEVAPYGNTVSYGELGRHAGMDDPRDVGALMGRNPLPLVVPCHRVVAADGLGGYGGGLELKRRLLELEGVLPPRLDLGDI
jgi:methylated-DNA-[protein]-cysteine S-methyltransferase